MTEGCAISEGHGVVLQSEESVSNARACGGGGRELASAVAKTCGHLKQISPDTSDSIRAYRCFHSAIFFLRCLISGRVAGLLGCSRAASFSILFLVSSFHFLHVSLCSPAHMAFPFYSTPSVFAYPRSRSPSHSGGHRHHLHACLHHRGCACVCLVFSVLFHK